MELLIALGEKKKGISESKACMGLMFRREDTNNDSDNASLRMSLKRVIVS